MKNSKKSGGIKKFTIIEKVNNQETFKDSNLNGNPLNEGPDGAIEDGYQNVNIERDVDTINIENIGSEIEAIDEKTKFKEDIKENGLHDSQIDKA